MSIEALNWAWGQDVTPIGAKFVLVALSNFADAEGRCWPGQATLAIMTGQTERNVRRALDRLEALGKLRRERERGAGGRFDREVFYLEAPADELRATRKPGRRKGPPADKLSGGEGGPPADKLSGGPADIYDRTSGHPVRHQRTFSTAHIDEPSIEPLKNLGAREADGGSGPSASARLSPDLDADQAALWAAALAGLARQMPAAEFNSWLGKLVLVAATAQAFTAAAPTRFVRDWIWDKYGTRLRDACGRMVELVVQKVEVRA